LSKIEAVTCQITKIQDYYITLCCQDKGFSPSRRRTAVKGWWGDVFVLNEINAVN